MAVFNAAGFNSNFRKSAGGDGYGSLIDQLSIKENSLSEDGKLSPGDYDLLIKSARALYTHPGLTPDQRSNIEVKLSSYKKAKSVSAANTANDVGMLNRESDDDNRIQTMMFGNDPATFLSAKEGSLRAKANHLADSIERLDTAGDDSTTQRNDYYSTISDLNEIIQAQQDVSNYVPGSNKPISNTVAYVKTNARGEITGIDISPVGSKTGYSETNGLMSGLRVYGKINGKDEKGNNYFKMGNQRFIAPDLVQPDPNNPMSFKPPQLFAEDQLVNGDYSKVVAGSYKDVDLNQVKPQASIPVGGYARGANGSLYRYKDNGKYEKYVNTDLSTLGIDDKDILSIPKAFEDGISPNVDKVNDGSAVGLPGSTVFNDGTIPTSASDPSVPVAPAGASWAEAARYGPAQTGSYNLPKSDAAIPKGRARPGTPVSRAPGDASGVAASTIGKAKNFLSSLFA